MKIRSDFVTNSSSASFILELSLGSKDGNCACIALDAEEDMDGSVIHLDPEKKKDDIVVGSRSIYSAKGVDELCDLLFGAARVEEWSGEFEDGDFEDCDIEDLTFAFSGKLEYYENREELAEYIEDQGGSVTDSVSAKTDYLICNDKLSNSGKNLKAQELGVPIITEVDFMRAFDEDRMYACDGITVSVRDAAPTVVEDFKNECAEAGITLDNLSTITVENTKYGSGDSAMFIYSNNDQFAAYKEEYKKAPEEQKEAVLEEFIAFIQSEPTLEVNDNEYNLPERMPCVWNSDEEALEKEMRAYLNGKGPRHWMGTYAKVFTIDVTGKTLTSREVLYFGDH